VETGLVLVLAPAAVATLAGLFFYWLRRRS
jgi:hypothetical protein